VHLCSQKKFQLSSSRKIILVKHVFYALVEKYFLPYCGNFFWLRNMPFYIRKKITAPKSKIEKIKIEDFFGRKLFFTILWQVFFNNKTEAPQLRHFDIPKKKFNPKIENFHSFKVSDLQSLKWNGYMKSKIFQKIQKKSKKAKNFQKSQNLPKKTNFG
jgi:hypothetical protein